MILVGLFVVGVFEMFGNEIDCSALLIMSSIDKMDNKVVIDCNSIDNLSCNNDLVDVVE